MSAGRLRNRVVIEQPTVGASSNGDRTEPTWSEFKTVWAGFKFFSGSEDSGDRDSTKSRVEIKIRYTTGITTKMRVNRGGEIYLINDFNNVDDRKKYITLVCERLDK